MNLQSRAATGRAALILPCLLAAAVATLFCSPAEAQIFRRPFYQPAYRPAVQQQPAAARPQPRYVAPRPVAAPQQPVTTNPPVNVTPFNVIQPAGAETLPYDPNRVYDASLMVMHLPSDIRSWFRNPDGSCVQCSQGMVGVENNYLNMTTLLWDTEAYGRAERGGSNPGRVASYARKRGMKIWNVTGDTYPWIDWCAKTGRFAAIGAGGSHFQTLYGRDFKNGRWYVCNNNSTNRVDDYSWDGFRRLHEASGEWVIIPDVPACPPPPVYVEWWKS